jgi:hypothetical protein
MWIFGAEERAEPAGGAGGAGRVLPNPLERWPLQCGSVVFAEMDGEFPAMFGRFSNWWIWASGLLMPVGMDSLGAAECVGECIGFKRVPVWEG